MVAALGDGYAALRPAVHLLAEPDVDKLNLELPFPCVWVSAWSREAGLEPLRHSLVVTAITGDDDADRRSARRTDHRAMSTAATTRRFHAPQIPHDGFLADALMRNKGFIGD